jgi:hypothetical protein
MAAPRGGNGSAADRARPVGESVRALQRDSRDLILALEQLAASAGDVLREQLDRRPVPTLGAGLLAGYVLGGGLSLRFARFLAATAGRATMAQLIAGSLGAGRATSSRAGRQS